MERAGLVGTSLPQPNTIELGGAAMHTLTLEDRRRSRRLGWAYAVPRRDAAEIMGALINRCPRTAGDAGVGQAGLPQEVRMLEAFHVTRLGFAAVDDVRRRVQSRWPRSDSVWPRVLQCTQACCWTTGLRCLRPLSG